MYQHQQGPTHNKGDEKCEQYVIPPFQLSELVPIHGNLIELLPHSQPDKYLKVQVIKEEIEDLDETTASEEEEELKQTVSPSYSELPSTIDANLSKIKVTKIATLKDLSEQIVNPKHLVQNTSGDTDLSLQLPQQTHEKYSIEDLEIQKEEEEWVLPGYPSHLAQPTAVGTILTQGHDSEIIKKEEEWEREESNRAYRIAQSHTVDTDSLEKLSKQTPEEYLINESKIIKEEDILETCETHSEQPLANDPKRNSLTADEDGDFNEPVTLYSLPNGLKNLSVIKEKKLVNRNSSYSRQCLAVRTASGRLIELKKKDLLIRTPSFSAPTVQINGINYFFVPQQKNMQRVYKCDHPGCNMQCYKSSNLTSHKRIHTGEKPYQCIWEKCTWKFKRSDELTRHKKTHTGVKSYRCDICDSWFTSSDHLKTHLKRLHSDISK